MQAIEAQGNWLRVRFEDGRYAWVFNGFLATGTDIPVDERTPKITGAISWAHGMTVDLRYSTNANLDNILWETYENTTVQIVNEDPINNLYLVKIETQSPAVIDGDNYYTQLYPNFTTTDLASFQKGIAGWVHGDFIERNDRSVAGKVAYPFDYTALQNAGKTTNQLVTQIFYEDFTGSIHSGIDFNLAAESEVKAVAGGTVEEVGSDFVKIKHDDGKISEYHHIVPEVSLNDSITVNQKIAVVAADTDAHKAHLHFVLKNFQGKNLNPAKYISGYVKEDGHSCVRDLIINQGIRDGELISEQCNIGVGKEKDSLCRYPNTGALGMTLGKPVFLDVLNETTNNNHYCADVIFAKDSNWVVGNEFADPNQTQPIISEETETTFEGRKYFQPEAFLSRQELLKISFLAAGYNETFFEEYADDDCFTDLAGTWGAKYICYAKERGFVKGYPDGTFKPTETVNFIEALKIAMQVLSVPVREATVNEDWKVRYREWAESDTNNIDTLQDIDSVSRSFAVHFIRQIREKLDYTITYISPLNKDILFIEGESKTEESIRIQFYNVSDKTWKADEVFLYKNENYLGKPNHFSDKIKTPNIDINPGQKWSIEVKINRPELNKTKNVSYYLYDSNGRLNGKTVDFNVTYASKRDFYYMVFDGWSWAEKEKAALFGALFTEPIYNKKYVVKNEKGEVEKLFAEKTKECGDFYEKEIVQVLGNSIEYNSGNTGIKEDLENMLLNYRTDRWYKVLQVKNGKNYIRYIPVSAVILKDDNLFKVTKEDKEECYIVNKRYSAIYGTSQNEKINKALWHNTVGSATTLSAGANYFLARNHINDQNKGYANRFVLAVPEYMASGGLGRHDSSKSAGIEIQSVSVEIVNLSSLGDDLDISKMNRYKFWNDDLNQSDLKGIDKFNEFTSTQYDKLGLFVDHMNEKYGIPKQSLRLSEIPDFEINNPLYKTDKTVAPKIKVLETLQKSYNDKYGFYFQVLKTEKTAHNKFINYIKDNFSGVISHKNGSYYGKGCPSPAFDITAINGLNN